METKQIEVDIKMTEDILKKYNSKMKAVRYLSKRFIPFVIFVIVYLAYLIYFRITNILIFISGFILAYTLMLISLNIRSKAMSKKLIILYPEENEYKLVISDNDIKIVFKDEDIRNKFTYAQVNAVYESKDLYIILHHLSSRAVVIPKDILTQEQVVNIKELLKKNVNSNAIHMK